MNVQQHTLGGILGGALLAALCAATINVASAETSEVTRSTVVHYSDLNLSTQEGIQKLYNRIRAAATRVCAESGSVATSFSSASRKCRTEAIDVAVSKVNNGILTALHQQQKSPRRYG